MLRVVIYESSPIFLNGLLKLIRGSVDLKVVESFTAETEKPPWLTDVFLVDVDITGARSLAGFVTGLVTLAPVLVLAHRSLASPDAQEVIGSGASGVVDRRVSPQGLLEAIRTVASGRAFASPVFDIPSPPPRNRPTPELSSREQQVLDMIARGRTHHQIARSMRISRHTVDTYVKRIRAKLHVGNKAELTRVAILRSTTT